MEGDGQRRRFGLGAAEPVGVLRLGQRRLEDVLDEAVDLPGLVPGIERGRRECEVEVSRSVDDVCAEVVLGFPFMAGQDTPGVRLAGHRQFKGPTERARLVRVLPRVEGVVDAKVPRASAVDARRLAVLLDDLGLCPSPERQGHGADGTLRGGVQRHLTADDVAGTVDRPRVVEVDGQTGGVGDFGQTHDLKISM